MSTKPATKKWTVMVYLAGDNNLDAAAVTDLNEMKRVGSTADVNVIAELDRAGAGFATKRYVLHKGTPLDADVVASLGETNMGDPAVLKDFITWGRKTYPAEHYLLVLWNHGAGWDDTNIYRTVRRDLGLAVTRRGGAIAPAPEAGAGAVSLARVRSLGARRFRRALFRTSIEKAITVRGIAYDDQAQDFLDNIEIKKVLSAAKTALKRKLDILGMDACLMSMAEVAYQVRGSVAYTVGSEQTEPNDGWPYDAILAGLAARPAMTPRELSAVIVQRYLASYSAADGVTQAALDLSAAEPLARAVSSLAKAMKAKLADNAVHGAIASARAQVQSYEVAEYVDLADFAGLLAHYAPAGAVATACQGVLDVLGSGGFVVQSGYKGKPMASSHGVSIYFPLKTISPLYARLDFCRKTAWDDFLRAWVGLATRRPTTEAGKEGRR